MTISVLHLNIADINLSLQFRQLNEETVADYALALANKEELPDADVAFDREAGIYYMTDGFHRLAARKQRGATMITANVSEMSKHDARWASLGANRKNGQRLSLDDKRAALAVALVEFPNASSRAIADHVGCSHQMVLKYKADRLAFTPEPTPLLDAEIADEEETAGDRRQTAAEESNRVVGTDGKSYPAKKNTATETSCGTFDESLPYTSEEQAAAQEIENAIFKLPASLAITVHMNHLGICSSTDITKPLLRTIPLQRGTDWENFPIRPFFKFAKGDWETLESGGIRTIGDLSKIVQKKITLPKFGKKKIENLEKQFEEFWTAHPELCNQ